MKIVVILPTFNERENIKKLIPILEEKIFPNIKKHDMNILIVDDKSPDGTEEEINEIMKKWKNISLNSGVKQGLGAAYVRGMTYAIDKMNADVIFEMDADLQHDPTKIPDFLKKIDEGYDMVIGTRYSEGGSIPKNWPPLRKAFSIIANIFVRTVFLNFSIHDWTGGYRALKKEVFLKEKNELQQYSGYIFQISFLHKAIRDKFKIGEVPFHFSDREQGRTKIAPLGYIMEVVKFVILTRINQYKRFIKFLFVGGTGFIVQVVTQEATIHLGITIFLTNILSNYNLVSDITSVSHSIGAAFGAEAAIISNFLFNNFWTFDDTRKLKEKSRFIVRAITFNFASLGSIFIQALVVFIAEKSLGEYTYLFSQQLPTRLLVIIPTILIFVIPLNYFIYNFVIWKTHHLKNKKD